MVSKDNKNIISALDVGTSKTVALIAELKDGGGFEIVGFGSAATEGVKKGVIVSLDKASEAMHLAVDAAEKMAGRIIESAVVGVSGNSLASSEQHGGVAVADPERGVSADDMRRAAEAAKTILLPPDKQVICTIEMDYTVDNHSGIKDPRGMSGSRLGADVQIVTGSTAMTQNLMRCLMKLEIGIDALAPTPFASGEAVLNEDEKEIGTVIVDIGAGTSGIAVFKSGVLRKVKVFPVGGWNFDNDIGIVLGASTREGERLKIESGIAYVDDRVGSEPVRIEHVSGEKEQQVTRGMLCQIIHARAMDMMKMIRHELETDMPISVVPAGVVLTGNGALLEGMREVAEQAIGMNARVGKPRYSGPHSDLVSEPGYAAALGLLAHAARLRSISGARRSETATSSALIRSVAGFFRGLFNK